MKPDLFATAPNYDDPVEHLSLPAYYRPSLPPENYILSFARNASNVACIVEVGLMGRSVIVTVRPGGG